MPGILHILLLIFPAVVLFGVLFPLYFRLKWRGETGQSVAVKALCTLVSVLFCLNGCLVGGFRGFWWLLAGLVLCLVGDIAIEKNLFAGMGAFAAAHLLFIAAFLVYAQPTLLSLPVFLVLYAAAAFAFRKRFREMKERLVPFLLYAALVLGMLSMALGLPPLPGTMLLAGGAALFALSDLTLARNLLNGDRATRCSEVFSLACYYGGLYLIALSVWL